MAVRFTIGGLIWWLILLARRRVRWPGWSNAVKAAVLGGLIYAPNALAYFHGTARVSGTVAAMAVAAVPVLVALEARLILKERLSRLTWISLALAVVGAAVLAGSPGGRVDPLGLLLLGGAISLYSLYMVLSGPVSRALTPPLMTAFVVTGGALFYWIWGTLSGRLDFGFASWGWGVAVALALIPTVVAMYAFLAGAQIVGPMRAAIVNALEPVVGVALSVLLLGERPGLLQIGGGCLVVLAAVLVQRERARTRRTIGHG